jgi:NAD(P)-dependent dehydrogenase (short-subunit alcohol dehydrogenase family)
MNAYRNIIVLASIADLFAGPDAAGYVTTKHACIGLAKSLARDYDCSIAPTLPPNSVRPRHVRSRDLPSAHNSAAVPHRQEKRVQQSYQNVNIFHMLNRWGPSTIPLTG